MIIHGTADIEAYFERLADNHPDIMDFVVGDSEHILSRDRSSLEYPCLWLESPNVNWDFGTKRSMDYEFSISILENVPDDAWRREQYLKHKLLLITGHILHQINQDAEAGIILLTGKRAKSMFLPRMGNDNSILWRTDLVFSTPLSWCAPTCKLPDACPAGTLAMFKWENSITGGFTGLSVTNLSKPGDVLRKHQERIRHVTPRQVSPADFFDEFEAENVKQVNDWVSRGVIRPANPAEVTRIRNEMGV